jgi:cytochrome c peroxidase
MQLLFILLFLLGVCGCNHSASTVSKSDPKQPAEQRDFGPATAPRATKTTETPVKLVGEKFFRDSRFSQYFFSAGQDVNLPLKKGDRVTEILEVLNGTIPNPYQGQAVSCAACHFIDQVSKVENGGNRAYNDFAPRSLLPPREDARNRSARNSPTMVDSIGRGTYFLHHDGEFSSARELIRSAFTGRNMGWLPGEQALASKHIVRVIREDNGSFPTDTDLAGFSYAQLLAGQNSIPEAFLLPVEHQIQVHEATDEELLSGFVAIMVGYLSSLTFEKDSDGFHSGSPYDLFLKKNGLPRAAKAGEDAASYKRRLKELLFSRWEFNWVTDADRKFQLHRQKFEFGQRELEGLRVFMTRGQCVQCHSPPDFTDRLFHNTGISQKDYESVHGAGTFERLVVPTLPNRQLRYDLHLPATTKHPRALETFRRFPIPADRRIADLGVWNIFLNPDMPSPQNELRASLCLSFQVDCNMSDEESLLQLSIAAFRTPTIRNLGQSAPYFHAGSVERIEDIVRYYIMAGEKARKGRIRNADPRLRLIALDETDVASLTAFLKSLNEDYD